MHGPQIRRWPPSLDKNNSDVKAKEKNKTKKKKIMNGKLGNTRSLP